MSLPFLHIPVGVDHLLRDKIQIVPRNQATVCYCIVYTVLPRGCSGWVWCWNEIDPLAHIIACSVPSQWAIREGLEDTALLDWLWLLCHMRPRVSLPDCLESGCKPSALLQHHAEPAPCLDNNGLTL